MNLIKFRVVEDFGHEYHLSILQIKNWCLFQSCFLIGIYARYFPYLNITSGSGRLLGINFQIWRFGATIELVSRSWFTKRYE